MMKLDWGFDAGPNPNASYYYRRDLAGGAILDNGCYTVSMARRLAGTTAGSTYRDPDRLYGAGLLHPEEGIDLDAIALLWWEGGTSAAISASFRTDIDKTILLTGLEGVHQAPRAVPAAPAGSVRGRPGHRRRARGRETPGDPHRRHAERVHDRGRPGGGLRARRTHRGARSTPGTTSSATCGRSIGGARRSGSTCPWTTKRPRAAHAERRSALRCPVS